MQRCPQERENVSHDRVERTQLETAARTIMEVVNTFNISEASKDGILRAVQWIASKSRDNLDNTLTEFLSRQLCRVIDFVDSLIHFKATNRVETSGDFNEVPLNVFPSNTFRRSVLLEAEAEGLPAGESCHDGASQRTPRVHLPEEDRPDVMIDIPDLTADHLTLDISDLVVRLALETRIGNDLVVLRPAVEVTVGNCQVSVDGLGAQALAMVRMDNIRKIVESTLNSAVQDPDILGRSLSSANRSAPAPQVFGQTEEEHSEERDGEEKDVDKKGEDVDKEGENEGEVGDATAKQESVDETTMPEAIEIPFT